MPSVLDTAICLGYRLAYLSLRAWWLVRRPATHGACVALWHEGKILLVRTSYRPCYSLPGGFVRRGEPSEQAARREMLEEVGIILSDIPLRLAWNGTLLYESRQDTVDIWEASVRTRPAVRLMSHELVWADWIDPGTALARPLLPHVAAYLAGKSHNDGRV